MTQMEIARKGQVSDAVKIVAAKERRSVEFIRRRVADGRIVIPSNINHKTLSPCGIGRELFTKINANIGNSAVSSCPGAEIAKLHAAVKYGADTVMDLSTGGDLESMRRNLLSQCTVPLGTVPVYEVVARFGGENFTAEQILQVIEDANAGEDDEATYVGVEDEAVLQAVFDLFKEQAGDEFDFEE